MGRKIENIRPFDAVVNIPGAMENITTLGIRVRNNWLVGIEFLGSENAAQSKSESIAESLTTSLSTSSTISSTTVQTAVDTSVKTKQHLASESGITSTSANKSEGKSENIKPVSGYEVEVIRQLKNYFNDPAWHFTLNLEMGGTVFQRRVWKRLQDIPHNEKHTYGEVAKKISSSPRAVGGACRSNPIPIVVPCHRVVAKNGLGGFCGSIQEESKEIKIKQWLLEHEKKDGARL